ncbi:hypothetical protein KFV02_08740 [Desulfohalobiaceae bacterium Ax17]|uniref:hypothetical protein n=1 Tax=Desulfovulcanus ferrireducens TaxID=2831190 RepID=UPI00207BAFDA|nr:hypothetical protein [Desulfovulcanus ferrireducens]MBT8764015.1 hypothetical protein [Desulfovulcanus ferrireducens]
MYKLIINLIMVCLFITGCTAWKSTKNFYKEYINSDPEIDLQANGLDNKQEEYFAKILYPMDRQLSDVLHRLDVQDSYPDEVWFEQMLKDFPWLNGVAAIDRNGHILFKRSAYSMKALDFSVLFTKRLRVNEPKVRVCVQDSVLGPEVYLGRPFFRNNQVQGFLVVHFDPRTWASLSPRPEELAIIAEGKLIWAGKYGELSKLFTQRNRTEMLKNSVFGKLEVKDRNFYWFSRALEENWLIYLMAESKGG